MYVVVVTFQIAPEHIGSFKSRVLQQASDSLSLEEGCSVFDVCVDPDNAGKFFLYEVYDSVDAFQHHLASAHFESFDSAIKDWVVSKRVETLSRLCLEN